VTLFKLEDDDSLPDSDPNSGLGRQGSPARRSKRVKVDMADIEGTASHGGDNKASFGPDANAPTGKGKGKAASQPPARRSSSRTTSASSKKPRAIKQALEEPHPAPARWRETYDAIVEMRSRFPAPVDTMGCDTAKWKEMDPRVRNAVPISLPVPLFFFFN
jgi:endonuclease-3